MLCLVRSLVQALAGSVPSAVKLWHCPMSTVLRQGLDGLLRVAKSRLKADPLSGRLSIFRNKSSDRLKVLHWAGTGLCLRCQRLEAGR